MFRKIMFGFRRDIVNRQRCAGTHLQIERVVVETLDSGFEFLNVVSPYKRLPKSLARIRRDGVMSVRSSQLSFSQSARSRRKLATRLAVLLGFFVLATPASQAQSLVMSQHIDDLVVPDNSVNCGNNGIHDNTSMWRSFELASFGVSGAICLERVQIGIEQTISPCGAQPLTVRLYADSDTNPSPVSSLVLLDERSVQVPDQTLSLFDVHFATLVPAGTVSLVVELHTPRAPVSTNTQFLLGTNDLGEIAPTYFSAPDCMIPEPVTMGSINVSGVHSILNVFYTAGPCTCAAPEVLSCIQSPTNGNQIELAWDNNGPYDSIEVSIDGAITTVTQSANQATLDVSNLLGQEIAVTVQGLVNNVACPGTQTCYVVLLPEIPTPALNLSSAPAATVSSAAVVTDVITVGSSFDVGRVQVRTQIAHPRMSDLIVRLTSPTGTEVTLHENTLFRGGFFQADLIMTFADDGTDNCFVSSRCDCLVTPFGPGSMGDFQCEVSAGDWVLEVTDLFATADGVLEQWSLGLDASTVACCRAPTNLQATSDCLADTVALSWNNEDIYDDILIRQNGSLVATLPGSATDWVHTNPGNGGLAYTVQGECNGLSSQETLVRAAHAGYAGETDIVLSLEGLQSGGDLGLIDSADGLKTALEASGRSVLVAPIGPLNYPCLAQAEVIWILAGTFPNDYRIVTAEGNFLASLNEGGIPIYFESADHWGFQHTVSNLDARDGVDQSGALADGDDSFTAMDGSAAPAIDLSAYQDVPYLQDQLSSDDTDRLAVALDDAGGPGGSAVLWRNSPDVAGEADYVTGIFQDNILGANMIVTSWEFGGLGAASERAEVAARYVAALTESTLFVRGDTNGDGATNIADAVILLGYLFPGTGPGTTLSCQDAGDANDDGTLNLGDVISILSSLFGVNVIPLPAPNPECGPDLTPDGLDCSFFSSC